MSDEKGQLQYRGNNEWFCRAYGMIMTDNMKQNICGNKKDCGECVDNSYFKDLCD